MMLFVEFSAMLFRDCRVTTVACFYSGLLDLKGGRTAQHSMDSILTEDNVGPPSFLPHTAALRQSLATKLLALSKQGTSA